MEEWTHYIWAGGVLGCLAILAVFIDWLRRLLDGKAAKKEYIDSLWGQYEKIAGAVASICIRVSRDHLGQVDWGMLIEFHKGFKENRYGVDNSDFRLEIFLNRIINDLQEINISIEMLAVNHAIRQAAGLPNIFAFIAERSGWNYSTLRLMEAVKSSSDLFDEHTKFIEKYGEGIKNETFQKEEPVTLLTAVAK
ncbi:MAG: hypothetical protein QG620_205 [Patescibacteria group bacterium]|nr:hypothetical protein [Patescibacteria group bacterium]